MSRSLQEGLTGRLAVGPLIALCYCLACKNPEGFPGTASVAQAFGVAPTRTTHDVSMMTGTRYHVLVLSRDQFESQFAAAMVIALAHQSRQILTNKHTTS